MNEGGLPKKKVMTWNLVGREKKKDRPKSAWMDGSHGIIEKLDLTEED